MADRDDARRANQRRQGCKYCCPECFGDVWLGSGYLPHAPTCERGQDKERAALARAGGRFPVADIAESPWSDHEDDRRVVLTRILRRAGNRAEGLAPKEDTE